MILRRFRRSHYPSFLADSQCRQAVLTGPFEGMRYVDSAIGSSYYPKLLGTYELELHDIVDTLIRRQFDTLVDVGAAEGYYACGMALKSADTHVIAFEQEETGRALIAEMAELNGLSARVETCGTCDTAALADALKGQSHALIIMDVEGAEAALLDPETIPALRAAVILVEIHDAVDPKISTTIRERFQKTHQIEEVHSVARDLSNLPLKPNGILKRICREGFLCLMREGRPGPMSWFLLDPESQK